MNPHVNYNLSQRLIDTALEKRPSESLFTFRDLKQSAKDIRFQSEAFATGFKKRDIGVDDRVLVILYDTPTFINVFLGLIAIGAIPVPVNPKIGEQMISYILSDSRAKAVIIEPAECDRLKDVLFQSEYVELSDIIINDIYSDKKGKNDLYAIAQTGISENINIEFLYYYKKARSVAFWQYTSGTTGNPKAVQHSQDAMIYFSNLFARDTLLIGNDDKIYSIPKMFFGYGLGNSLFYPMLLGAEVLLDDAWPSLQNVRNNLKEFKPTVFFCVPKMYLEILKHPEIFDTSCFESVRVFFSAGSNLTAELNKKWENFTGCQIVDGIGTTELGHVYLTNKPGNIKPGFTGWPINDFEVKLDSCGWNESLGELLVKPPFPMYGYWEDYEKNCAKFKDGWYHTGDQFLKEDDGSYQYVGRVDDLFKVNGRWVIPSQIELAVLEHFSLDECALVCCQDELGDSIPVLFFAGIDSENMGHEIVNFLSDKFEKYMLPKFCFSIAALPKNDNGKVVKRNLVELATQTINETSFTQSDL